jgi:hypothetical protein
VFVVTPLSRIGGRLEADEFVMLTDGFKESPSLTEPEYVDRMLRFANAPSRKGSAILQRLSFELGTGVRLDSEEENDPDTWQTESGTLLAGQKQLVQWLEIVIGGQSSRRDRLVRYLCRSAERLVIRPEFYFRQAKLERDYRFFPVDLEAAAAYAVLLLMNEGSGADRLCRCRFVECQGFFLEVRQQTGSPRRKFCIREHLDAARKLDARARISRYRERKRLELKTENRGHRK